VEQLTELLMESIRSSRAGRRAEAEAHLRQLLDAVPDDAGVLAELATLARQAGMRRAAVELMNRAVHSAPGAAGLQDLLGQVLNEAGDYEASVRAFERVLELEPAYVAGAENLARARRDLAIALDPDYATVPGEPWTADSVREELHGSRTLLVLFAGLGIGAAPPTFIFRRFLAPYTHVDKLFLRDLSRSWYLHGLPGVSADVASTVAYLRQRRTDYDRLLFLGCSAGGTAAILYGELVPADRVIAFAPQTVLGERKPRELRDDRWEPALVRLRASLADSRHLDLAATVPLHTGVDIYYPHGSPEDRAHAEALAGPRVRRFPQPGASHVIALEMRDDGRLKAVVDEALA